MFGVSSTTLKRYLRLWHETDRTPAEAPEHSIGSMTMQRMTSIGIGTTAGLGALLGAGWLGLKVEPASFAPYPESTVRPDTVALPADLPAPVDRYFRAALGDRVPIIESAVLTGRGRLRFAGLTFPTRIRFTHEAGRGYRHYIECTWFGMPVLKVNEAYLDDHARMEQPFGVVANEPKVDMAANLSLWGESIWLPSIIATDPRVRWEAIDRTSARLVVPFGEAEDSFTVAFDEQTGLIRSMEALRYRAARDAAKLPWRIEPLGWLTFHGLRVPSPAAVTWLDQARPWLVVSLEHVAYNVDVSQYIHASGL